MPQLKVLERTGEKEEVLFACQLEATFGASRLCAFQASVSPSDLHGAYATGSNLTIHKMCPLLINTSSMEKLPRPEARGREGLGRTAHDRDIETPVNLMHLASALGPFWRSAEPVSGLKGLKMKSFSDMMMDQPYASVAFGSPEKWPFLFHGLGDERADAVGFLSVPKNGDPAQTKKFRRLRRGRQGLSGVFFLCLLACRTPSGASAALRRL